jgi:hypothetical protein
MMKVDKEQEDDLDSINVIVKQYDGVFFHIR